jgi:hypothetical protein
VQFDYRRIFVRRKAWLDVSTTFAGGNAQLQTLSLDGSIWINVGSAVIATASPLSICRQVNTGSLSQPPRRFMPSSQRLSNAEMSGSGRGGADRVRR